MKIKYFLSLLLTSTLFGTEYKPWYPDVLELQGNLDYRYQTYSHLAAKGKNRHYSSDDSFVDGRLLLAYDPYCLETEIQCAATRKQNFDVDHLALTGRYLFMDDNVGDPFSISAGLTLSKAWKSAVNDISSFHHGQNEALLHLSVGDQHIYTDKWVTRWWGVGGVGIADRWTPWIIANIGYEWNFCNRHQFDLFADTLWGCGSRNLRVKDFGGYSKIDHRSIDIGGGYTYNLDYGKISLNYSFRVYAHNYPAQASNIVLSYTYFFGPEGLYPLLLLVK